MPPDNLIQRDSQRRPDLFHWNGEKPLHLLNEWAKKIDGKVPHDLMMFWASTGGGEAFETETFLSPFGDSDIGDDVDGVTEIYQERGLSKDWILFHIGWGASAFRPKDGQYAWFKIDEIQPSQLFDSLDDWYNAVLKSEYADRYSL